MPACKLCGQLVAVSLPPDAPPDAAARGRLKLIITGSMLFSLLVQSHREQAARLLPVLGQIQAFIRCAFNAASDAGFLAVVEALRGDLVAWLSNPDAVKVAPVMPAAADLPIAAERVLLFNR